MVWKPLVSECVVFELILLATDTTGAGKIAYSVDGSQLKVIFIVVSKSNAQNSAL